VREGFIKVIAILGGSLAFSRIADQELVQWHAAAIEAGEPAAHPGLMERCYHRACAALGQTPEGPAVLSFWQRLPPIVIHWFPLNENAIYTQFFNQGGTALVALE